MFIIFQREYKGLENKILISARAKSLQPNFVIHVLIIPTKMSIPLDSLWIHPLIRIPPLLDPCPNGLEIPFPVHRTVLNIYLQYQYIAYYTH